MSSMQPYGAGERSEPAPTHDTQILPGQSSAQVPAQAAAPQPQPGPPQGQWTAAQVPAQQPAWAASGTAAHGQILTDRRDPNGAVVAIAWILTVVTLAYFLPWAIAATRGKSNQAAVGIVNFLLGWTFVGWVVALVMACTSHHVVAAQPAATFVVAQQFTGVQPGAPAASAPPAGWYPAPDGVGRQYWGGTTWTEHRAP